MVFLTLFIASCAAASVLIATLMRSSRFLTHLFEDQPVAKAPAIAGPPRLTLVSNASQTER
jgi:hypothetical protein